MKQLRCKSRFLPEDGNMAKSKERPAGGSFTELRKKHLPLFDQSVHRHDRGWPHGASHKGSASRPRLRWKTAGIVHFRYDVEREG